MWWTSQCYIVNPKRKNGYHSQDTKSFSSKSFTTQSAPPTCSFNTPRTHRAAWISRPWSLVDFFSSSARPHRPQNNEPSSQMIPPQHSSVLQHDDAACLFLDNGVLINAWNRARLEIVSTTLDWRISLPNLSVLPLPHQARPRFAWPQHRSTPDRNPWNFWRERDVRCCSGSCAAIGSVYCVDVVYRVWPKLFHFLGVSPHRPKNQTSAKNFIETAKMETIILGRGREIFRFFGGRSGRME